MHWSIQICIAAAMVMLIVAALHDLALRTVPNGLTATLGVCALILAAIQQRLFCSLAIASPLLLMTFALWLRGYMGGGDAKLLTVCGLLVAPSSVVPMLLTTAVGGGVLCLPYLFGSRLLSSPAPGRPTRLISRLLRCERWRLRRRGPLPYAVAIAAGTISALLHGA